MKNKRNYLILLIVGMIFSSFGATIAYLQWANSENQKTILNFSMTENFSCSADGGGNITNDDTLIVPTICTNSTHAIKRTIKTNTDIKTNDILVSMNLWLDIQNIGSGLSNSMNFKWAITTNPNSCTKNIVNNGTFNNKTSQEKIELITNKEYFKTAEETYYLYVWLDEAETSSETMNQEFSLSLNGMCTSEALPEYKRELNGATPVIEKGMIPVTISNNGAVKTADLTTEWYNYGKQKWANAVLVTKETRDNYYEIDGTLKSNEPIPETNILAYFVWIPKFSYKINEKEQPISIAFNTTPSEYIEHPAFNFDGNISGFWIGKFETGHSSISSNSSNLLGCNDTNCANADKIIIKPNVTSKRYDKVALQFYASRSMERANNPFGLIPENVDTHMLKNTEWGAVAYLSQSIYGIKKEIRMNNTNIYQTGCGALELNNPETSNCEIKYGEIDTGEYPQSTTGNITGVFDMSGGANEYVMGYYTAANSNYKNNPNSYFGYNSTSNVAGFTSLIDSKYWNEYKTTTTTTACDDGICYGQALSETAGWYGDYDFFVLPAHPWLCRGGYYSIQSVGGIFLSAYYDGRASTSYGFRIALVSLKET